jgi:hypothetical protein
VVGHAVLRTSNNDIEQGTNTGILHYVQDDDLNHYVQDDDLNHYVQDDDFKK